MHKLILLVSLLLLFTGCEGNGGIITSNPDYTPDSTFTSNGSTNTPSTPAIDTIIVPANASLKIYDGDTFTFYSSTGKIKVRLYGIDAPEKAQEYGEQSTTELKNLIQGKSLTILVDSYDQYGRAIGQVYVGNTSVNQAMIERGAAWWYQYYAPNNKAFQRAFENAQAQKIGLWAYPNPQNPYEYRKGQ